METRIASPFPFQSQRVALGYSLSARRAWTAVESERVLPAPFVFSLGACGPYRAVVAANCLPALVGGPGLVATQSIKIGVAMYTVL